VREGSDSEGIIPRNDRFLSGRMLLSGFALLCFFLAGRFPRIGDNDIDNAGEEFGSLLRCQ
jgi:hypothetical protein